MNTADKEKFIRDICNSLRETAIDRVKHMPEDWDGIEIREYLAHVIERDYCILSRNPQPDRRRLRDFKNTVATHFGL